MTHDVLEWSIDRVHGGRARQAEVLTPKPRSLESLTDRERIERVEQQVSQLSMVLAKRGADAEVLAPTECSVESLTDRERIQRLEQQVAQLSLVLANLVTKGTR